MLASTMNNLTEAQRHVAAAREFASRSKPNIWEVHIDYREAQILQRHNYSGGREGFDSLVRQARESATGLGMVNMLAKLDGLVATAASSSREKAALLTPKELAVLELIAKGRSNKQIATQLNRSLATVATHVRAILGKTHAANRTEAAAYAREQGLFQSSTGSAARSGP